MKPVFGAIDRSIEALIVFIFFAIVAVGAAQVFNRYFLNASLSWSEEFQRYGQIWMVFLAIPAAYRRGMHMGVEGLKAMLPERGRDLLIRFIDVLWIGLGGTIAVGTLQLMTVLQTQRSAGLGLPMHWVYGGVLIGALYMVLVGGRRLFSPAVRQSETDIGGL